MRVVESRLQQIDTHGQIQEPDVILKAVPATPLLGLRDALPGLDAVQYLVRRIATTVPAMVGHASIGYLIVIIHSPLYDPEALDVEVGYLLTGKGPQPVVLTEERMLTLRALSAVGTMATLAYVGLVSDSHHSYGALATWIEHHGWQMSGAVRELLI